MRPDVVVDHAYSDDAAIVRVAGGRDLVLTADVIAPLVDDPEAFGAIAAANSLSDVWAMGGEPRFALNLVFFPDDVLPLEVLDRILAGGARMCREAGVAIVGGHTVRDPEPKFGLSVTGDVGPGELWTNRTAQPGQALVLTKALGTGVLGQAIKKGLASEAAIAAAITSMTTLNASAARIGHAHGVTSATDVTGFGLLGHLRNIVRGSNVAATVEPRHCRCCQTRSSTSLRSCAPPAARRTARTSHPTPDGPTARRCRPRPGTPPALPRSYLQLGRRRPEPPAAHPLTATA